jgi:hypothetical protein
MMTMAMVVVVVVMWWFIYFSQLSCFPGFCHISWSAPYIDDGGGGLHILMSCPVFLASIF